MRRRYDPRWPSPCHAEPTKLGRAVQLGRGKAGQLPALSRQVGLVAVAGPGGGAREIGVGAGEEAPQSQHPLQRLGAVADGTEEAPVQLALAEAELGSELTDPPAGGEQADDGGLHGAVRWPGDRQAGGSGEHERRRVGRVRATVQVLTRIECQLGQTGALVGYYPPQ